MKENEDVKFHEELDKMEYEPLNDTEVKLIRNSLIIGTVLLVLFYFVAGWLFPGAHA
ncbi:hypothetical protein LJC71_07870 [Desulfosarcina sp. OttesenSCG-928-A07]|nr:hypothetical protein [Desulfosarcina sp. OttesenSCG-928-G17]MDL2329642.1 hypothetical protein [Desulfosarcina sp. OttesenSCG-928-A07]